MQLGDDLDFIGLCGSSNLLLFLSADERRAFLKWFWGLVYTVPVIHRCLERLKLFSTSLSINILESVSTRGIELSSFPSVSLLVAQYPLQMNAITQPRVRYIHMAMPHAS